MTDGERERRQRFDAVFTSHCSDIVAYCGWRAASASDAHDAAAEVFLIAWRRLDELPEGDAARVWLYATARRVIANQRRSTRRQAALYERLALHDPSWVQEAPSSDLEEALVHEAIRRLGPTARRRLHRLQRRCRGRADRPGVGLQGGPVDPGAPVRLRGPRRSGRPGRPPGRGADRRRRRHRPRARRDLGSQRLAMVVLRHLQRSRRDPGARRPRQRATPERHGAWRLGGSRHPIPAWPREPRSRDQGGCLPQGDSLSRLTETIAWTG